MRRSFLAILLLVAPALALAQGIGSIPPACTGSGKCRVALTAPSYTSSAGSGADAFTMTTGAHLHVGSGANERFDSNGSTMFCRQNFSAPSIGADAIGSWAGNVGKTYLANPADGASAIAHKFGCSPTLTNATAKIAQWCADTAATCASPVAWVYADGTVGNATEKIIIPWWFNAAAATGTCPATGTGCVGHTVGAHPVTITAVTGYVSVASGGGAANTVITITDGTNTCTATFACNTVTNTTGTKRVATVNGAGTGCVYAASAALSAYVSTAGCTTTQPTFRNIDIVGKQQ